MSFGKRKGWVGRGGGGHGATRGGGGVTAATATVCRSPQHHNSPADPSRRLCSFSLLLSAGVREQHPPLS